MGGSLRGRLTCLLAAGALVLGAGFDRARPATAPDGGFVPPLQQRRASGAALIRLNQIGFYPTAPKIAIVVAERARTFDVLTEAGNDTVFKGRLSAARRWPPSGEVVRQADFSGLTRPGRYVLSVPGVGRSYPFAIGTAALREAVRAAEKAFYYQRASIVLLPRYAGKWSRAAGHPDDSVIVHPSAASAARPAGTPIVSPGGWYDAGDYNKYVVNSGISTYTLLALVEHYTGASVLLQTNIPESGDGMADVMHEALWNLRWMRTMQDPDDGGVYHKLTNAEFDKFVMPSDARATRYVVQKSTAATLDFAAVAAHAALIVPAFPQQLPGLADSLVAEARAAWSWARQHPDSVYDQQRLNARFQPHINTGAYDDTQLRDELRWAAAELYLATKEDSFLVVAEPLAPPALDLPNWQSVRTLGVYSLLEHQRDLPRSFDADSLRRSFLAWVRPLALRTSESAYGVSMRAPGDFAWGSNAVAANQGMAFLHAFRLSRDTLYLRAAVASADYVLGRNATGYSFVTGFGSKTPLFPHHRPSRADTVRAPVPGMLVGGPNPGQQDNCPGYPTRIPAKSYVDSTCAYAANEIAINWNAPFVYLAGALDAIYSRMP